MAREPIPTWCFALVVARRGDELLLVHERKHGQRWYLPAGRVEPGESLAEAAVRETCEEAGGPARVRQLPLRGPEVLRLFEEVAGGAPVYPMSLLTPEGWPLVLK